MWLDERMLPGSEPNAVQTTPARGSSSGAAERERSERLVLEGGPRAPN